MLTTRAGNQGCRLLHRQRAAGDQEVRQLARRAARDRRGRRALPERLPPQGGRRGVDRFRHQVQQINPLRYSTYNYICMG